MTPRIISHRGKLDGPDFPLENTQSAIWHAMREGFDVEIDVFTFAGELWLGHNELTEMTDMQFLWQTIESLWIHCKDLATLEHMMREFSGNALAHYFMHDKDEYALVSNELIWAYPTSQLSDSGRMVSVLPECGNHRLEKLVKCRAICTDYPRKIRDFVNAYENCNSTDRTHKDIQGDWEKFLEGIPAS